ncbi:MAG: hypothetical protein J6S23_03595 [Clostridia bacterium]|nr:hypothetical protein [Clostridia bacterium]
MKEVKRILTITICFLLVVNSILFPNMLKLDTFAEENADETEVIDFETLERQILNSERWCNATDNGVNVSLDIGNRWFLPN